MTKKKEKFGGALDESLDPLVIGPLMTDERTSEVIRERNRIESYKLDLLAARYGLRVGDDRSLALAVVREFVDGFKVKKRRGRPSKWDDLAKGYLYVEVQRRMVELGHGQNEVVPESVYKAVAAIPYWYNFLTVATGIGITPDAPGAIQKAYLEAKKSVWSKITWDAYLGSEGSGSLSEWDQNVAAKLKEILGSSTK